MAREQDRLGQAARAFIIAGHRRHSGEQRDALRPVAGHGFLLPAPDGKAIWKASVAGDAGWCNVFTFLKVSPALIWEAEEERPAPFAGTVVVEEEMPTATLPDVPTPAAIQQTDSAPNASDGVDRLLELFDASPGQETPENVPQEAVAAIEAAPQALPDTVTTEPGHALSPGSTPQACTEPSGEHFIAWLRQRIARHVLIINDAKALVHTVADTAYLVSPGIFQRYAQEHPNVGTLAKADGLSAWQWIQKRFEKLSLHRKQENGLNL